MILSLIAAVARNRAIGYQNRLLFHIKADLEHFKRLTMGHVVIMGRHTFESLPNGALPHRKNIVISKSVASFHGCTRVSSFKEALDMCQTEEEVFVIGGEQVYKEAIKQADRLYLTEMPRQSRPMLISLPITPGIWWLTKPIKKAKTTLLPSHLLFIRDVEERS